jgi:hypothetical protein
MWSAGAPTTTREARVLPIIRDSWRNWRGGDALDIKTFDFGC